MTVKNNFRTSFIKILETISAESNLALKISAGHSYQNWKTPTKKVSENNTRMFFFCALLIALKISYAQQNHHHHHHHHHQHHHHHHHICFNICFPWFHGLDSFSWKTSKHLCLKLCPYWLSFPFFQNASNYVIPQFPWLPSGQPTTNLEVSLITRPSTLLQSC